MRKRFTAKKATFSLLVVTACIPLLYLLRCADVYYRGCACDEWHGFNKQFMLQPSVLSNFHFHRVLEYDDVPGQMTQCFPLLPGLNHWPFCAEDRHMGHLTAEHAIAWLMKQQNQDGTWGEAPYTCELTGMVLSSLMIRAISPQHEQLGDNVVRAIKALVRAANDKSLSKSQMAGVIIGLSDAADMTQIYVLNSMMDEQRTSYSPDLKNPLEVEAAARLYYRTRKTSDGTTNEHFRAQYEKLAHISSTWKDPENALIWPSLDQPFIKRLQVSHYWNMGYSPTLTNPGLFDENLFWSSLIRKGADCYWTPESLGATGHLAITNMSPRDRTIYATAIALTVTYEYRRFLPAFEQNDQPNATNTPTVYFSD